MRSFFSFSILLTILGTILALNSCTPSNQLTKLNGEWTIIEANGQPINISNAFIGFDVESARLYGNSGCNNMSATLDIEKMDNEIEIENFISTLAYCEDSDTELNIHNALAKVEKFNISKDGNTVTLYDDHKKAVLILKKRTNNNNSSTMEDEQINESSYGEYIPINMEVLNGDWEVIRAGNLIIQNEEIDKQPIISFDTAKKTVAGSLSCNSFSSPIELEQDNGDIISIHITAIMATRMACKNMKVENELSKALSSTKHVYKHQDETLGLYDDNKTLLIVLRRK